MMNEEEKLSDSTEDAYLQNFEKNIDIENMRELENFTVGKDLRQTLDSLSDQVVNTSSYFRKEFDEMSTSCVKEKLEISTVSSYSSTEVTEIASVDARKTRAVSSIKNYGNELNSSTVHKISNGSTSETDSLNNSFDDGIHSLQEDLKRLLSTPLFQDKEEMFDTSVEDVFSDGNQSSGRSNHQSSGRTHQQLSGRSHQIQNSYEGSLIKDHANQSSGRSHQIQSNTFDSSLIEKQTSTSSIKSSVVSSNAIYGIDQSSNSTMLNGQDSSNVLLDRGGSSIIDFSERNDDMKRDLGYHSKFNEDFLHNQSLSSNNNHLLNRHTSNDGHSNGYGNLTHNEKVSSTLDSSNNYYPLNISDSSVRDMYNISTGDFEKSVNTNGKKTSEKEYPSVSPTYQPLNSTSGRYLGNHIDDHDLNYSNLTSTYQKTNDDIDNYYYDKYDNSYEKFDDSKNMGDSFLLKPSDNESKASNFDDKSYRNNHNHTDVKAFENSLIPNEDGQSMLTDYSTSSYYSSSSISKSTTTSNNKHITTNENSSKSFDKYDSSFHRIDDKRNNVDDKVMYKNKTDSLNSLNYLSNSDTTFDNDNDRTLFDSSLLSKKDLSSNDLVKDYDQNYNTLRSNLITENKTTSEFDSQINESHLTSSYSSSSVSKTSTIKETTKTKSHENNYLISNNHLESRQNTANKINPIGQDFSSTSDTSSYKTSPITNSLNSLKRFETDLQKNKDISYDSSIVSKQSDKTYHSNNFSSNHSSSNYSSSTISKSTTITKDSSSYNKTVLYDNTINERNFNETLIDTSTSQYIEKRVDNFKDQALFNNDEYKSKEARKTLILPLERSRHPSVNKSDGRRAVINIKSPTVINLKSPSNTKIRFTSQEIDKPTIPNHTVKGRFEYDKTVLNLGSKRIRAKPYREKKRLRFTEQDIHGYDIKTRSNRDKAVVNLGYKRIRAKPTTHRDVHAKPSKKHNLGYFTNSTNNDKTVINLAAYRIRAKPTIRLKLLENGDRQRINGYSIHTKPKVSLRYRAKPTLRVKVQTKQSFAEEYIQRDVYRKISKDDFRLKPKVTLRIHNANSNAKRKPPRLTYAKTKPNVFVKSTGRRNKLQRNNSFAIKRRFERSDSSGSEYYDKIRDKYAQFAQRNQIQKIPEDDFERPKFSVRCSQRKWMYTVTPSKYKRIRLRLQKSNRQQKTQHQRTVQMNYKRRHLLYVDIKDTKKQQEKIQKRRKCSSNINKPPIFQITAHKVPKDFYFNSSSRQTNFDQHTHSKNTQKQHRNMNNESAVERHRHCKTPSFIKESISKSSDITSFSKQDYYESSSSVTESYTREQHSTYEKQEYSRMTNTDTSMRNNRHKNENKNNFQSINSNLQAETSFTIETFTGNKWYSGTDANVFVTLFGSECTSDEIALANSLDHKDPFERGNKDTFKVKLPFDLGFVYRLKVRHDNSGSGPAWLVSKIVVKNDDTGRRYDFAVNRWLFKHDQFGLEEEVDSESLPLYNIDPLISENSELHHTSKFQMSRPTLIVRRGQTFKLSLKFARDYETDESFYLTFKTGERPRDKDKTLITATEVLPKDFNEAKKQEKWCFTVRDATDLRNVIVEVFSPANALPACYSLVIDDDNETVCEADFDVYVLFNPWCREDEVYMEDEQLLREYILKQKGQVYVGNWRAPRPRKWYFGQFEEISLLVSFKLLAKHKAQDRDTAVEVARIISSMVNSNDNNGVLIGNWTGKYEDGKSPTYWTSTPAIFDNYAGEYSSVKYGQCWVFSAIVTTVMRALGIPCRSVTNFSSAHDSDASCSNDRYYDVNGDPIEGISYDSVWNFHVWNDVWMERKDLPPGYGGWQAIDATPQEKSDDIYCMGPASLRAIKEGRIDLPFDTPFAFAEVNADTIYWQKTEKGEFEAVARNKTTIGRIVSTKAVGSDEMDDITHRYKFPEGSALERNAVKKSLIKAGNKAVKESRQDIELDLEPGKESYMVGEDVTVLIKVKNTSSEDLEMTVSLSGQIVRYTGLSKAKLAKMNTKFLLKGNQGRRNFTRSGRQKSERVIPTLVRGHTYVAHLKDDTQLRFVGAVHVPSTNQSVLADETIGLDKPTLKFSKLPPKFKAGKEQTFEVSFKNPLATVLTKCELYVDGTIIGGREYISKNIKKKELHKTLTSKIRNVSANGDFVYDVTIKPVMVDRLKKKSIIVAFCCEQLGGLQGDVKVNVDA